MKVKLPPVVVYQSTDHFFKKRLKRKKPKVNFWTVEELNLLFIGQQQGKTYAQIAKEINRTPNAVAQKVVKIYRDYDVQDFTLKNLTNGKLHKVKS